MRIATILFFLVAATGAFAQSRNVAYLELGGNGIIPTINYERQLAEQWFGRIGFSFVASVEADGDDDITFVVPVMVNYLTHPAGKHHFEAGAGVAYFGGDSQDLFDEHDEPLSNLTGTVTLGYRYQKPGRGFVFRAGFTPVFYDSGILPWGGLSAGYRW